MHLLLRIYRIEDGRLDEWLEEWSRHVVPLRRRLGFEIRGAWVARDESAFVWLLAYAGDDLAAANEAYYASPEREALSPDPARLIKDARELVLDAVDVA